MKLTGKEIAERVVKNIPSEKNIQQVGVDVTLKDVWEVDPHGKVLIESTITPSKTKVLPGPDNLIELQQGKYYEFSTVEGCCMPSDVCGRLHPRSSMVRCGGWIQSGIYDPGFYTDNMGGFITPLNTMYVEVGARVAQFICDECGEVSNLYNGQFQGK